MVYTSGHFLVRGQAEVEYKYGNLRSLAETLPYENTHAAGEDQFRRHLGKETLRIRGDVNMRLMPSYRLTAYVQPESWRTFRAVRWKNGFPDVLFDFFDEEVLISQARPETGGFFERLREMFGSGGGGDGFPEFSMRGPFGEIHGGGKLTDLMTVFLDLEKKFTLGDKPPEETFYLTAMRRDSSNIYVARFEPEEVESVNLEVNGRPLERPAARCQVSLYYGYPVELRGGPTIASLAARFLPDKTREEAMSMIREVSRVEQSMREYERRFIVLPVTISAYNRIHRSDKEFEGPFGLAESMTIWIDKELGIPLRAETRLYGFPADVMLSGSDEQYLRLLEEGL